MNMLGLVGERLAGKCVNRWRHKRLRLVDECRSVERWNMEEVYDIYEGQREGFLGESGIRMNKFLGGTFKAAQPARRRAEPASSRKSKGEGLKEGRRGLSVGSPGVGSLEGDVGEKYMRENVVGNRSRGVSFLPINYKVAPSDCGESEATLRSSCWEEERCFKPTSPPSAFVSYSNSLSTVQEDPINTERTVKCFKGAEEPVTPYSKYTDTEKERLRCLEICHDAFILYDSDMSGEVSSTEFFDMARSVGQVWDRHEIEALTKDLVRDKLFRMDIGTFMVLIANKSTILPRQDEPEISWDPVRSNKLSSVSSVRLHNNYSFYYNTYNNEAENDKLGLSLTFKGKPLCKLIENRKMADQKKKHSLHYGNTPPENLETPDSEYGFEKKFEKHSFDPKNTPSKLNMDLVAPSTSYMYRNPGLKLFEFFDIKKEGTIDLQDLKHILTTIGEPLSGDVFKKLLQFSGLKNATSFDIDQFVRFLSINPNKNVKHSN